MTNEESARRAGELAKVIVDDIAVLLQRRLDIAKHVYSPAEQTTAIGMVAEAMIGIALGVSVAGIPPAMQPVIARATAKVLRSACDREEIAAPVRMGEVYDALAAFVRGARP